jgi:biopolymer transport protein ExbB
MGTENLFDLVMHGGFTIFILIACSILSLKVVVEKLIQFTSLNKKHSDDLLAKIMECVERKSLKDALHTCKTYKIKILFFNVTSPLANVFKYIFEHFYLTKEELTESAFNKLDQETTVLEDGLGVLATLGSVSPFIGLFGTVIGIIKSFSALSLSDTSNYAHVMSGIAEALIATAAGLLVAVPAVLFYNYFMKKIKLNLPAMDEAIHTLVRTIKK